MPSLSRVVATNIYELRIVRKLTQGRLAAAAALSVSYISMLERHARTPPLVTLEKLARALRVEPTVLLKPDAARGLASRLPGRLA